MSDDLVKENSRLLREAREMFIAERAKQERAVAEWAEGIKKLRVESPSVLAGIELPDEISLRSVMPELYEEEPDEIKYGMQYEVFMEQVEKVNTIALSVNKEAHECLLRHQQLISSGA